MKKYLFLIIGFLIAASTYSFAQPANLEGNWNNGTWSNSNALTDRGVVRSVRVQATGTANREFLFNTASANYNPQWTGSNAPNFFRAINTRHSGGAFYYTTGGWNSNLQFSATNSSYYTFIISENNTSNNDVSILETSYNPRTINGGSVVQSPSAGIYATQSVSVSATLNNTLQSGEFAYVRYSTDNWATSSLVAMSLVSGNTYSATIPGQTGGTTVRYYVLTSNSNSFAAADADYFTLELNNNSGANYSYTVATTYFSSGNVAPHTLANWKTNRDGSGTSPANFTTSGNIFVIQGTGGGAGAPHTMTSSSTMTFGAGTRLIIEDGGILRQTSNITFNASATFQMNSGSKFIQNSSNATSIVGGIEEWAAGSTVEFTNSGVFSSANITGGYQNVLRSESSGTINANSGLTLINGDLTINPTTATRLFRLAGATGDVTCTIKGNLNIQAGGLDLSSGSGVVTLNVEGNINISGGTLSNSGGTASSINFTKIGTSTYTKSGGTISNLINWVVNSGTTLDFGTSQIDGGTGSFTLSSGAGIITANTAGITSSGATGSVQVSGTRTYSTSANYTFNGTAAQVTGNGFTGANNLTIDNSAASPAVTLSTSATVTGNLTLTAGQFRLGGSTTFTYSGNNITRASGTLDANTNTSSALTFTNASPLSIPANTFLNVRNLTINGAGGVTINSNINIGGTGTFTSGTLNANGFTLGFTSAVTSITRTSGNIDASGASSIVSFTNTNPLTLPANLFTGNITTLILNGAGGVTLGSATTVSTTLTLTNGTLTLGGNTFTYSGSGTSITKTSGFIDASDASAVMAFTNTTALTLPASLFTGNVNTLTINGSGGVTLGSATTVSNQLNLTSGVLTNGSFLTMGDGATINRSAGSLSAVPTFGTTVNITYSNTSNINTGNEMPYGPSNASILNNLTFNCSGGAVTVTLQPASGGIQVNGTLALSGTSTGTFGLSTNTVTFGANATITRTGSMAINASNTSAVLNFTNSNLISLPNGALQTTVTNLTINGAGGIALGNANSVTITLNLTNGNIILNSSNLTVGPNTVITGGSATSHIVTNGTGKVLRLIANSGGIFTFPIGRDETTYNPVTITNNGGTNITYTVGAAGTTYSPVDNGANAQWSITSNASTTSDLAFQWLTADAGTNLNASPSSGKAYQYNGSTWDNRGGTTTGTPNTTTVTGITDLTNPTWTVAMIPAVADIAISANAPAAGNIVAASTNNIIYGKQIVVTTANTSLTDVTVNTTGTDTYAASAATDLTNFKLWINTTNSLSGATQLGSTITNAPALGGTLAFTSGSNLPYNVTTATGTYYLFVTCDVASGAVPGRLITISSTAFSNINFSSGNKTGTDPVAAGNTQTIIAVPSVTTNAASSIATTSVVLNGTVNANANSTVASFDYGTTMSYGTNVVADQSPVTGTSNTSISKTVTGLNTNTLYNYRAKGVNDAGTTNGSNAAFTTLSNAPTVGTGDNATAVGFRANWTAPTNDGSEAITYTVEVDDDNTFASVNATENNIATTNFTFITLNPGTTYYYRVRAVNAGGNSAWSAVSAGIATTSSTIATVSTAAISSITVNSASGGGEVVIDGGDPVTERGIVFNTTGTPTTADTKVTSGTGVGTFTANLSSLSTNTTYYVRAYAINGVGTAYGNEVNFTTLAAEPTTQSTVAFGTRTNTSLVVNFTGGNGARRVVFIKQGSAVDYTPTDAVVPSGINTEFGAGTEFGSGNYAVYDGTGTNVTVTGLIKNTTYYIAVYEYNNNSALLPNYFATAGTGSATTYNPTITPTGTISAFGNVVTGTNSSSQSYTVEGTELAGSITITAPTGFAISLDDIDFSVNPIILAKNGSDAVPTTTIYVRFSPASATGATGSLNITHTSTDATTQNVAVSGNAIALQPTTEGSISFGTITTTSIVVNLPTVGNGGKRLVVVKAGSAVDANPADATSYTANATFGSGTQIGTGNYVVYNDNGSGSNIVTVTGLSVSTTYHFAVFEYNEGTGTSQNYLTPSTVIANQQTTNVTTATDAFRTVSTGNWNSTSTWESFSDGVWIAATLTPDASASAITIRNTHEVTIPNGQSISADDITVEVGGQITIAAGGTLTVANGAAAPDLTVNGYLKNTGTLTLTGTATVSGSSATYEHNLNDINPPAFTWASNSTLRLTGTYTGAGTNPTGRLSAGAYQNIIYQGTIASASDFVSFGDNAITIAGKLTASGSGSGALLTSAGGTPNLTVAEYEQTSGIVFINRNSSSATRTLTVTGNATISGGTMFVKTIGQFTTGEFLIGGNLLVENSGIRLCLNNQSASNGTGLVTVTGNVTIRNSATVQLSATTGGTPLGRLQVAGDLTVEAGATLTNAAATGGFANVDFISATTQQFNMLGTFSTSTPVNIVLRVLGGGTVTLNNAISVGNVFLTSGTLAGAGNLTIISGSTITRAAGTFSASPIFAGTVNVTYANASPITSSHELPSSNVTALSTAGGSSTVTIGSSTNISTLTVSGSNLTIGSGVIVTASSTSAISATKTLQIDGTYSAGAALTNSGTLNVGSSGRYIHNTGTATLVTATWNTGSTCEIQNIGGGTSFAFGGQTLHHLIWNNSNQAGSIQLSGSLAGVNGNLEIQNCGNNATRYFRLTNASSYSLSIGGNLNISAVNGFAGLDVGNSSGTNATITVGGDVIVGASGSYVSTPTGNTLKVAGNWSNSGTFTSTNTTVEFNGTTAQSITGTTAFNNLTINKSSDTLTVNSNISIASAGSLNLTAGILNDGGHTISVAGNVTGTASAQHIGSGKILMNNTVTRTFSGNIAVQNIEFGGSSGSNMVASSSFVTTIFGNAIFSGNPFTVNTGNTLIFGDTANIYRNNGVVNAINQSGGTINYGTTPSGLIDIFINATCNSTAEYIITQSPGIVNSVNIADGVTYTIPGSRATTTLNLNNTGILAFNPSTTLTYTINGSILGSGSISGHINASLTLTNGSNSLNLTSGSRVLNNLNIAGNGTLTLQTPVELMGNLTLTSGGVLADNGQTVTLNGNISNTGTHTSTSAGKIVLNGTTKTISGATLGNVDIGSVSSYSLSGSPTINGVLTLLANVDLASSGYTLNLANTSVVEAGTSQMIGTGTVNIDGIFKTANTEGFTGANTSIPDATVNLGATNTVEYTSATAQTFTTRTDYKNVTISGSGEKTLTGNPTIANTLALTAGTLAVGTSNTLTIGSGGSIAATSGSLATGSNGGTIAFAGTGTVSGTVTFNNVTLAGGVNFGSASTIGANGTLQLNSGGFVTGNAPEYASTATLIYNNTGSYNRTLEWSATSGKGYPGNVLIQNGTTVNTQALSSDIGVANHLTLGTTGSAGSLNMNSATNKIIVGGNVQIGSNTGTSTLTLSSVAGGDIKVGGNWTRNANGVFTSAARAIFFTGSGTNELSATGGESVGYLVVEKTGGSVKMLSNLTITADNAGTAMSLPSTASFDLNGNTLLLNGTNQSIILADGGVVNFTGAANSTIEISNAIKTVATSNNGTVVFGDNVLIAASTGINFGNGLSTVNGIFRINGGGFVQTNPPVYGPTSTLQYNSGSTYGRFLEWSANSGAGYPANVQLSNNTTLNYPNTGAGAFSTNLSIAGNLTIDNGSALYLGFGDNGNKSGALTVAGNVTVNGPLGLGNATGGNLLIGGNWTRAASNADFFPNGRQLIFNGTGAQSISRTGGETFANTIVVNKASGVLTANNNITFNDDLTLTSGTIDDGGHTLTVNGNIVNTGTHTSTGSGKLVMNGTSKTISGATLGNVEIASSTISLSGNPTINGVLTLTNSLDLASSSRTLTLSNTSTVEAGTNQLIGTGTVNVNGVFKTARTQGFSGANTSIPSATVNVGAFSTVEYTATAAQTITARTDYAGLTIAGASVKSLSGNTTVAGTLLLTNSDDLLSLGANTFTLNGTITGSGRLRGGATSNLVLGGTGSLGTLSFDQSTDGTTNVLNNFTLNRTSSGAASLGNKLVITNVYTPTAGVLTTNNHLHLRSTVSNTARIASGSSSGGYITGDVTVERYMSATLNEITPGAPHNRAWRMLTPGVTTSTTINANWQEGKVNTSVSTNVPADVAGYGVHITGAGGSANGFDVTQTNAASLYRFDQSTQSWALITNTNVNTLDAKQGYLLFVRGNRDNLAPINTATGNSNVVIRARGTLLQGTQTFSGLATANNFSLVTNPFASPINWTSVYTGANATNFNSSVTIWDPNIGTRGGFVTVNSIGISSSGESLLTEEIQSGQAFFIQTQTGVVGNPSFTIEESHKSTTNNLTVFRTSNQLSKLKIQLRFTASNVQRTADGVVAIFGNSYSNGLDGNDAEQVANWDEDIALSRNGKDLSIESRNTITANDTLYLKIGNLRAAQATYSWLLQPEQLNAVGLEAFLQDNFTNTTTPISLTAATTINFTVSSNAASTAANRFSIVFRNNAALPVTITQFAAQEKDRDVALTWQTAAEQNIAQYEVERSNNAQEFTKIATVAAKANATNNTYTTIDARLTVGTYYYRLRIVEKDGKYSYSKVVPITVGKGIVNTLSIYPNPIKGSTINLQLNNVEKGNYVIRVYSISGQLVYHSSLEHKGGSLTKQMVLAEALSSGSYRVEMMNEKGLRMVATIMKE